MRRLSIVVVAFVLVVGGLVIAFSPTAQNRLLWGYIQADAYLRGVFDPAGEIPTPLPTTTPNPEILSTAPPTQPRPAPTQTQEAAPTATFTPQPSPTPLPQSVILDPPEYELQDINGCGPATLAMYLRYYGWEGDQNTIDEVIKPYRTDRNVNVEELAYYAWNYAGWLGFIYRVDGSVDLLKTFIANGIPVMIEEGDELDQSYWPDDDRWAGHFLLLTGYDDATGEFIAQDSFRQANRRVSYEKTDERWRPFNRMFMVAYLPHQESTVQAILGADWDLDTNRQHALETAQAEIDQNPEDGLAWFNLGSNLVYFEDYQKAAEAYDQARQLGLPQRMLRYQFGPFHAYFHTQRFEDLLALAEYALRLTPESEEAFLWKGWALYNLGDSDGAVDAFRSSYEANPTSYDASYALNFMGVTP